ncbi:MAG: Hpt domain-containing protein, partial [Luteimonas sp.]|nr:Hpt domain-containing protein [Luteimonas sp.]
LDRPLPSAVEPVESAAEPASNDVPPSLEPLHHALAGWRDDDAASVAGLAPALDALLPQVRQVPVRRMLWVAANVARAIADGAMSPGPALRKVFAGVERELRRSLGDEHGFADARGDLTQEPTRQLLYHVAHSDAAHAALIELRQAFDLDQALPTPSELEHARGSISGRNRALLDTVSAAVKDDLLHVKDALDLHLRTGSGDIGSLHPQVETLARVADTLGMLGLGVARNVVQQQRDAMQAIIDGRVEANEDALLDVAGALLYVDATLDDQVARLGMAEAAGADQGDLFAGETRQVVDIIVREAISNFVQARQALVAFVETSWQHDQLAEVPRLLQEVAGALRMMELPVPADYLVAVGRYTENELIARRRVPNGRQLDTLADALASLEYYLEALRERRGNRDEILDIARNSLESLGYWPLPDATPMATPVSQSTEPEAVADAKPESTVAAAEARVEPAQAPPPVADASVPRRAAVAGGFETVGEEIDEEIREVFLEEFAEEIDNLDRLLPQWRAEPDNLERLAPVRRVFHTLKGSGRLVGARTLGEFSWKIEHMLNQVRDGKRPASPAVVAMVDRAFYTLPELMAALRGEGGITTDLGALQDVADRIASGEEVAPADVAITPVVLPTAPRAEGAQAPAGVELVEAGQPLPTVPAKVDALLLEILSAEVGGHLQTVDAWLLQARAGDTQGTEALLRALHTMNGAFAMTEVPVVNGVLGPAEQYVRRLLAARTAAGGDAVDAISELAGVVRDTVAALQGPSPALRTQDDLAARLVALRDSLPEVTSSLAMLTDPTDEADVDAPAAIEPAFAGAGEATLTTDDLSAFGTLVTEGAVVGDQAGAERVESERLEVERLEAERLEAERVEAERVEAERVEAERLEAERLEAERVEAERVEAERLEAERLAAEVAQAGEVEADAKAGGEAETGIAVEPAVAAILADAMAEDPDAALDMVGVDAELVDIFIEEASDLLDHSDGLLAQLRQSPDAREPLVGLQRDLHTIKGGARMAGVFAIGELGHAMESLLEAVVEQRCELDRTGIGLLERGFDRLHAMVTRVGERRAIATSQALIDDIVALAHGQPLPSSGAGGKAADAPKAKPVLAPLSGPIEELVAEDDTGIRAPQEQVRIRADLLDRLVNYAGEVAIYRARLEQQLGAFRAAMNEMEQTNTRLRDQLRRLDIETEAQIIARFQREGDSGDASFDPLELDRFSTLQQLSRALGESAADMVSLQQTLDDLTRQYETLLLQQSRVSSDLQDGLMRTRMVPFDALVPRLRRVLRQAAVDTGKQVQLKLEGTQGELDRNVLDRMVAPLEHMLRNAVAHGIESPDKRRKANKPEEGEVRIAVRREGSEVVLEVGDDGSGLDRAAIRSRALERGLIRDDATLSDGALDALIFEPGFSTAAEVSRLAGRGVGMDVVASEVRQLGGSLDIATRRKLGTTFTLRLPQALAVTQAVFVRIGETTFAVPIASVRGVGRIARDKLAEADASYAYGGEDYALQDLGLLVGQGTAKAEGHLQMPLLLIRSGELRAAVAVDEIVGNREVVVKTIGPQLARLAGVAGATVLG